MAADSGQPQDTKPAKKPVTPEQRKLYTQLGVIGVLALITAGIYLPGMFSGSSTPNLPVAPTAGNTITTEPPSTGATPAAGGAGTTATPAPGDTTTTTAVAPPVVSPGVSQVHYRADPFQEAYFVPTPAPPIPAPVSLPSTTQLSPLALPGRGIQSSSQAQINLPPVRISRLDEAIRRPTDAFPPRRSVGGGGGGGSAAPSPSLDKRLSGIVIGDGIHALLEIQRATGVVTHVVQPGDEVDGITILNIQRFNDGTRTVTRMLIRENGEERTVELRPGQQTTGTNPAGP